MEDMKIVAGLLTIASRASKPREESRPGANLIPTADLDNLITEYKQILERLRKM